LLIAVERGIHADEQTVRKAKPAQRTVQVKATLCNTT